MTVTNFATIGAFLAFLIAVAAFLGWRKGRSPRREIIVVVPESTSTHRKLSKVENIGNQIANHLKPIADECIIPSGSRLKIYPLWGQKDDEFTILVGWNCRRGTEDLGTNGLMHIIVSPESIRIEMCGGMYAGLVKFPQPYHTNTSPSGVSQVMVYVSTYLRLYYEKMTPNNLA